MPERTLAEEAEEAARYAIEEYRKASVLVWRTLAEGGRLPGFERVSPRELVEFFRSVPVEEWQRLAQTDPQRAAKALRDFAQAEEEVTGGAQ